MGSEIPFSAAEISQADIDAVSETLRNGGLATGLRAELLEQACAKLANRNEAVAVSSGTAALHCILAATGLSEGDEVLTTPYSHIATTNCILYSRAKPVFVDICSKTMNLNPEKLQAAITPKTRVIVAVEALGHPGAMPEIEQIARRHELVLVEDACEALGAKLGERPIGSFGRASCFSFNSTQQVSAGEGGVILTDDDRLAELCRSLRNQGRDAGQLYHRLGFNYRLGELSAALALSQLARLSATVEHRRLAVTEYFERLMESRYFILPTIPNEVSMSWYTFAVRLNDLFEPGDRDEIIRHMRSQGIGCGTCFQPIHLQPHIMNLLGTRRGDFPVAEYLAERTIALPLFTGITETQIDRVCTVLDKAIEQVLMGRTKPRF